jgi:hypothetical protein
MQIIFIADFFADEILGGGELNNEVLADSLRRRGHTVVEQKSSHITSEYITEHWDYNFIVGNFVHLPEEIKRSLASFSYIIYEHDHKYLRNRNPAFFSGYVAPPSEIINEEFYKNALGIFCQSDFHYKILHSNLSLDNIKNVAGNAWSDESLEHIAALSSEKKQNGFSILDSNISHKNTLGAARYCESLNAPYEFVSSRNYHDFLKKLAKNDKFVFLPQTPETLSRVAVEARMLGMQVHTNSRVGAASEKWFSLKGVELIEKMRLRREEIVDSIESIFTTGRCSHFTPKRELPKISILTSLYKGDEHIDGFMRNMVRQSVFDDCELIIVDANSPGDEKAVIEKYLASYPNIIYKRLDHDPGIYGCWNIALELSTGEFITNANLDDRRSLQQLEIFAGELIDNPDVDLVYSQCFVTHKPNEEYSRNSSQREVYPVADFTPENMIKCLPGCMPLWRRTMHGDIGLFNEEYKFAGDWDMWLRAVKNGSKFSRVEGEHGLYYHNPAGLTTDITRQKEKFEEERGVFHEYRDVFGENNYESHKGYFSQ